MGLIANQLSKAVLSAINGTPIHLGFIPHMLRDLTKLGTHPACLTEAAYTWCSVIYENRQSLGDWESLLLVCLKIGFRHLAFQYLSSEARITHTEHHRGLVDVVFKSQESEAIADLLHAWTMGDTFEELGDELLSSCAGHLVGLQNLVPLSLRLRRLVIRSVQYISYEKFEGIGVGSLTGLLNHLHVTAWDVDMDREFCWTKLLLETFQTFEGAQHLSHWYWEVLVELAILGSPWPESSGIAYRPRITTLLTAAQEWDKLECWMGAVWVAWPPGAGGTTEEDLDLLMVLLFRQRPGALQKLEQWMEQWSQRNSKDIPESLRRVCERAYEAAQRDAS